MSSCHLFQLTTKESQKLKISDSLCGGFWSVNSRHTQKRKWASDYNFINMMTFAFQCKRPVTQGPFLYDFFIILLFHLFQISEEFQASSNPRGCLEKLAAVRLWRVGLSLPYGWITSAIRGLPDILASPAVDGIIDDNLNGLTITYQADLQPTNHMEWHENYCCWQNYEKQKYSRNIKI